MNILGLIGAFIQFEETGGSSTLDITSGVSTFLSSLLGWLTSLTTWIVGDPLAKVFFTMMLIMFAIKVVLTLVHNA